MSVPAPWRRLGDRLEAELDGVASSDAWLPFSTAAKGLFAAESLPAEERERARCKLLPLYVGARDALMALFQERAPLVAQFYGEHLERFLIHFALEWTEAEGRERFPAPPAATLFPGAPMQMSRAERKRHFLALADFLNSLGARRVPGRKKGQPKPEKSGRRALDPALAERAYQLHRDGKKDRQIAQTLNLKDPRSETARFRARRLIDLGQRLSREKIAPILKKPVR